MKRELALTNQQKRLANGAITRAREVTGTQELIYCLSDGLAYAVLMYAAGVIERKEFREMSFEAPYLLRLKNESLIVVTAVPPGTKGLFAREAVEGWQQWGNEAIEPTLFAAPSSADVQQ